SYPGGRRWSSRPDKHSPAHAWGDTWEKSCCLPRIEMRAICQLLHPHQLIGIDNPGDIQRFSKASTTTESQAGQSCNVGKIRFKAVKIAEQFLVSLEGHLLGHQIDSFSRS